LTGSIESFLILGCAVCGMVYKITHAFTLQEQFFAAVFHEFLLLGILILAELAAAFKG
jgi:hypothetical protein